MTEPTLQIRKEILQDLQDHLQTLEEDLLFEQDGGQILYIVDFAALYAYIWKKCQGIVLRLPDEKEERVYARRQVALSYLFGGRIKNLLLIPPYSEELCDHVETLDYKAQIAHFETEQLEKLKRLIKASPEFQKFHAIQSTVHSQEIANSEQSQQEKETLRKAVIELGKNYFPELFAIITCEKADVLSTLHRVFDQEIIVHSDTIITSMADFGGPASIDCMAIWKKRIEKKRKEELAFATIIDAFGCAYLEMADKRLQEQGCHRMVVFVSSSGAVTKPLRQHEFRSAITGLRRNPVRDLDFFWVRSVAPDLESVRQNRELVVKLLRICDSPEYSGQDEAIPDWRQAENLLLITDGHLLEYSDTFSEQAEEDFLAWLNAIHEASTQNSTMLDLQRRRLFASFRQKISQIDKILPTRFPVSPIVEIEAKRAFLKGLSDEAGVVLELFDRSAVGWVRRVGREQSADSRRKMREEILDWASQRTNTGGLLLVAAYMLAAEEKYDAALGELLKGLPRVAGRERKELLYLAAMIERKLFKPAEALEHILAALDIDSEDPRFHVECGKIHWLKWQREREERRSPSLHDLKTAIEHLESGLKKAGSAPYYQHLAAQAENALAFIHCEQGLYGWPAVDQREIAAAEAHLGTLREQTDNSHWLGRYDDTAGWVLYAKAVSSKNASAGQRKRWLLEAEDHIKRALQREASSIARQRLVRSHLIKIRQALAGTGH